MFCVHAATFLNRLPYSPDYNASRCMQTVNAITVVTLAMLQEYELHGIFRGCCSVGFRWQDMENTHLREHLQVCHSHASNLSNADNVGYIMPRLYCYTLQHAEAARPWVRLHCPIRRQCSLSDCILHPRRQKGGFYTTPANSTTHPDESRCSPCDCAMQSHSRPCGFCMTCKEHQYRKYYALHC